MRLTTHLCMDFGAAKIQQKAAKFAYFIVLNYFKGITITYFINTNYIIM